MPPVDPISGPTAHVESQIGAFFDGRADGVAAVYVFGSMADGTARQDSDVDIGVLFDSTPASTLDAGPLDLEAALERQLGRPVDVVTLNRAPVDLRIRVLRGGRLIVDRDRSARIRFEVATRNEFFDFEPVLRAYRTPRATP